VLELFGDGFNTNTVARIDARLIEILRSQFYVSTIGAAFAGTALAAAATDIGQEARALPNPPNAQQVDDLSRRLDLVLFATAAVLVAGVIAVDTWSAWPSPLVGGKDVTIAGREAQAAARDELRPKNVAVDNPSDSNAAAQVEALKQKKLEDLKNNYAAFLELKNGFIAIQSVCYVGALVLIFLPAAASIDSARRRLAGLSGPTMFKVDQILRVLAILSPVLVGPITRFLAVKLGIGG
jgi:hypothetical protein